MSDPVNMPTPMNDSRARTLAALVYREGGHLEVSLDEMLAAPDNLIVTSTESGSIILRDPDAHEWDGETISITNAGTGSITIGDPSGGQTIEVASWTPEESEHCGRTGETPLARLHRENLAKQWNSGADRDTEK